MSDQDTPRFKTPVVAAAAGITHATMRSYFKREQWRVIGKKSEGGSQPNLFSQRDALTFAVAARLIEVAGVHPKQAFDIAVFHFAHTGADERVPGALFDIHQRGETLLVYHPDTGKARMVAADDVHSVADLLGRNQSAAEAAVVINLNPLHARVLTALEG